MLSPLIRLGLLATTLLAALLSWRGAELSHEVRIVPFAGVTTAQVRAVQQAVADFYQVPVRVLPVAQLPATAICPVRHRYQARAVLQWLASRYTAPTDTTVRWLALTTADIEVEQPPKRPHWGVMGLAQHIGGDQCIVSTFRLQGRTDRLLKVSLHEIGHTLCMPHCLADTAACLMNDARGKAATVDAAQTFICRQCRERLRW